MAVIAVGDFDKAAIEAQIKSHFGSIPAASSPKPRPAYAVPDQPGTRYSVITDPETTVTHIGVYGKMAARDQTTVGAYRQQMVERLFSGMLSARLDEIAQTPNAPFLQAETDRRLFVRAEETTTLDALVAEGGVERGLSALFTEIDRVARFGFTATELNRQRLNLQRFLEKAVVEKDKSPSGPLADEFVRNFIQGEPIPGIVYEYGLNQRFLPQITLAEVNSLAKEWMPDRNRLVVVSAPEKDRPALPSEAKLAAVIKAASGGPLTAYVDAVSTQPLLAQLPSPGAIATTSTNEALGITEWRLSNGVRVVLKPTTFKQDEILFRAVSPGGTSLASDQDFVPAETAEPGHRRRRSRQSREHRPEQDPRRHQRGGQSRHRRDRGRARRRRLAQRSRNDVSAHLSHLHGAAGRPCRVPRADRAVEGGAGQPGRAAGHGVHGSARCRPEPEPSSERSR